MAKVMSNVLKLSTVFTFTCIAFLIYHKVRLRPHLATNKTTNQGAFQTIRLEQCACSRKLVPNQDPVIDLGLTTCGKDAFQRGTAQKVISYSYFGDPKTPTQRQYFQGIALNAKMMHQFYPGWVMRVYHNLTDGAQLCDLMCRYDNLDFCDIQSNPQFGSLQTILPTIWRFVPIVDDQVRFPFEIVNQLGCD